MNQNLTPQQQKERDELGIALSTILGARVVKKHEYEALQQENTRLKQTSKNYWKQALELCVTKAYLEAFMKYHRKWKPTTRRFENRLKKLQKEGILVDTTKLPSSVGENLREAYSCYANDTCMACYILLLRSLELVASDIYDAHHPAVHDSSGKVKRVPVMQKLFWLRDTKRIGGADFTVARGFIEARNDSVHDVFVPTDRQLMAAFETVVNLVGKLQPEEKQVLGTT